MTIKAIETRYAGCRFRSRLEARWAVFFDALGIEWDYEPEGFELESGRYLPDFLLPDCGTWIEVKGLEAMLDRGLLLDAAANLPDRHNGRGEPGPRLMVLGPLPRPLREGDWGWPEIGAQSPDISGGWVNETRHGFGAYRKNRRPWFLDNASNPDIPLPWTEPRLDPYETCCGYAYQAARSARFEHGESG